MTFGSHIQLYTDSHNEISVLKVSQYHQKKKKPRNAKLHFGDKTRTYNIVAFKASFSYNSSPFGATKLPKNLKEIYIIRYNGKFLRKSITRA